MVTTFEDGVIIRELLLYPRLSFTGLTLVLFNYCKLPNVCDVSMFANFARRAQLEY